MERAVTKIVAKVWAKIHKTPRENQCFILYSPLSAVTCGNGGADRNAFVCSYEHALAPRAGFMDILCPFTSCNTFVCCQGIVINYWCYGFKEHEVIPSVLFFFPTQTSDTTCANDPNTFAPFNNCPPGWVPITNQAAVPCYGSCNAENCCRGTLPFLRLDVYGCNK